jgi:hypothetical protein
MSDMTLPDALEICKELYDVFTRKNLTTSESVATTMLFAVLACMSVGWDEDQIKEEISNCIDSVGRDNLDAAFKFAEEVMRAQKS